MQRITVYDEGWIDLRSGFTTGSCAAAAAKAAASMLLLGNRKNSIRISTPAGIDYEPLIEDIVIENDFVSCGVRKDSGDDPDITNGILIYAAVSKRESGIVISGGEGIGFGLPLDCIAAAALAVVIAAPAALAELGRGVVLALTDAASAADRPGVQSLAAAFQSAAGAGDPSFSALRALIFHTKASLSG